MRHPFAVLAALGCLASLPAAPFSKPDPDKAFADQKIYDARGRPWRAAIEDWDGAKHRVATDPAWAAWLKREEAAVGAWMAKRREWVGWVVEDDQSESPLRGELLAYAASPARVSAAQSRYRTGIRATRTLEIKGDTLADTATLESTAQEPQTLGLALHVQGKARLPESFSPAENFAAGRPEPFGQWRDVRGASFRNRAEFDVDYGKVVLHVTLTAPGEFTLWHGDTPDAPPARRESFYLELRAPAKSAAFTTAFSPTN